jgi:hypothetical protein
VISLPSRERPTSRAMMPDEAKAAYLALPPDVQELTSRYMRMMLDRYRSWSGGVGLIERRTTSGS